MACALIALKIKISDVFALLKIKIILQHLRSTQHKTGAIKTSSLVG